MRFGLFYELQLPRPWREGDEHRLLKNAPEQVELADRLGYDCVWEVEHQPARAREKRARLAPALAGALARRPSPRRADPENRIQASGQA